ncbi:hypothetical protein [Mangrovibacter phragmitis]|uniref:hypothetical protein n=1 Tax=Mangrovibacter phragmitis TaxID=1691903 RepID=UPI003513452A
MQINNFITQIEQPDIGDVIGRVGGNIPKILEINNKELINMRFYATFQDPENNEKYISIFVPNDYNTMIEKNIYPNCSVRIFLHDKSEESQKEDLTIQTINKSINDIWISGGKKRHFWIYHTN